MATSAIDQKDKDETGTNISEADKEKDTKSDTSTKSVLEQAAETLASIREFDQKWNVRFGSYKPMSYVCAVGLPVTHTDRHYSCIKQFL